MVVFFRHGSLSTVERFIPAQEFQLKLLKVRRHAWETCASDAVKTRPAAAAVAAPAVVEYLPIFEAVHPVALDMDRDYPGEQGLDAGVTTVVAVVVAALVAS